MQGSWTLTHQSRKSEALRKSLCHANFIYLPQIAVEDTCVGSPDAASRSDANLSESLQRW
jgi:hypothetical protein